LGYVSVSLKICREGIVSFSLGIGNSLIGYGSTRDIDTNHALPNHVLHVHGDT
jgi:hypothetical protein